MANTIPVSIATTPTTRLTLECEFLGNNTALSMTTEQHNNVKKALRDFSRYWNPSQTRIKRVFYGVGDFNRREIEKLARDREALTFLFYSKPSQLTGVLRRELTQLGYYFNSLHIPSIERESLYCGNNVLAQTFSFNRESHYYRDSDGQGFAFQYGSVVFFFFALHTYTPTIIKSVLHFLASSNSFFLGFTVTSAKEKRIYYQTRFLDFGKHRIVELSNKKEIEINNNARHIHDWQSEISLALERLETLSLECEGLKNILANLNIKRELKNLKRLGFVKRIWFTPEGLHVLTKPIFVGPFRYGKMHVVFRIDSIAPFIFHDSKKPHPYQWFKQSLIERYRVERNTYCIGDFLVDFNREQTALRFSEAMKILLKAFINYKTSTKMQKLEEFLESLNEGKVDKKIRSLASELNNALNPYIESIAEGQTVIAYIDNRGILQRLVKWLRIRY